jgi:hypothetical protein
MRATAFVLAAVCLGFPAPAHAQQRPKPSRPLAVTLTYDVAPGLLRCPLADALHSAVTQEMGYDPFVDGPAPLRFKVSIARRGAQIAAVMELRDDTGLLIDEKHNLTVNHDCKELVVTVATVLDIWIYVPPVPEPPPPCPVCPPPPAPLPPPEPRERASPPPQAPPPPRNLSVYAGIDAVASFAIMPSPGVGPGFFIALRLREPALSIELEGRTSWTLAPSNEGGVPWRSSYYAGVVAVCDRFSFAFFCPTAGYGTTLYEPGADMPSGARQPGFGTLGARAGVELPIGGRFAFRSFVGMDALLGKSLLMHNSADVREAPPAAASVGLALAARLW